jgi:hypothetical protein
MPCKIHICYPTTIINELSILDNTLNYFAFSNKAVALLSMQQKNLTVYLTVQF